MQGIVSLVKNKRITYNIQTDGSIFAYACHCTFIYQSRDLVVSVWWAVPLSWHVGWPPAETPDKLSINSSTLITGGITVYEPTRLQ